MEDGEHRSLQGESDTRWHTSLPADSAIQPGQAIWCPVHLAMKSVKTKTKTCLLGHQTIHPCLTRHILVDICAISHAMLKSVKK